jgi:hypothetical protein
MVYECQERTAVEQAKRKARYGHKDWLIWRDRQGVLHTAVSNYDNFKSAMLATGTQGRFTVLEANTAVGFTINWRVGVAWIANIRHGFV